MAPTLVTSCTALSPEGAACRPSLQGLRLRAGEAGSAALACGGKALTLVTALWPPKGAEIDLGGPALRADA